MLINHNSDEMISDHGKVFKNLAVFKKCGHIQNVALLCLVK